MARYSDFFTSFQAHPDTKQLLVKTDERAISQSIRNLILTNRGERPFEKDIGSNIRALLFENFTEFTEDLIEDYIRETLTREPRAQINNIVVKINEQYGSVQITIEYLYAESATPAVVRLTISRVR